MKREDVERILRHAKISESRGYLLAQSAPHQLAALCRAWLALDKSVPGIVTTAGTDPESGQPRMIVRATEASLSDAPPMVYRRVRVVVEDAQ